MNNLFCKKNIFLPRHYFFTQKLNMVVFSIIAVALRLLLKGYIFQAGPMVFTLAKIFSRSTLYPGDIILRQPITSFLIPVLAFLEASPHFEFLLFILYISCLFSFFYIILQLTRYICVNKKYTPYIVVFFLLLPKPVLGGVNILELYFSYSVISFPLMLFCLLLLFKKRYFFAAVVLGVTFNIHPIPTFVPFSFFLTLLFLNRKNQKVIGLSLGLAILLFLPLIIWKLGVTGVKNPFLITGQWYEALKLRSAHHYFPFMVGQGNGRQRLIFLVISIFAFWECGKLNALTRKVWWIIVLSVCSCLMYFLAVIYFPVALIVQLYLYRNASYIMIFACMFFGDYVVFLIRGERLFDKLMGTAMAVCMIINSFSFMAFFMVIHTLLKNRQWLKVMLVIFLFLLTLKPLDKVQTDSRFLENDVEFSREIVNLYWMDVQLWVKANTLEGDLFITPPYMKGFRYYSERGTVGDWKGGTLTIYDSSFSGKWIMRMRDLNCLGQAGTYGTYMLPVGCRKRYNLLKTEEIKRIAQKYSAQYIISEKRRDLEFKKIYKNDVFDVYEI